MLIRRRFLFGAAALAAHAALPQAEAFDAHRAIRFNRSAAPAAPLPFPHTLYANGESGEFWDVSDLTKLAQISDGSTPVTVADDPVGYMGGQRGIHNMTQGTAGSRPLYKSSGVTSNLNFDDSNDFLAVSSSTALFTYLHNGTGGSAWAIGTGNNTETKDVMGTKSNTSTAVGFRLYRNNASRPGVNITNGSALVAAVVPGAGSPWAVDTPGMPCMTYSTADGIRIYFNGVELANAGESVAPSSANSASNLMIGNLLAQAPADWRVGGVINRVLTPAEVLALYTLYQARGTIA